MSSRAVSRLARPPCVTYKQEDPLLSKGELGSTVVRTSLTTKERCLEGPYDDSVPHRFQGRTRVPPYTFLPRNREDGNKGRKGKLDSWSSFRSQYTWSTRSGPVPGHDPHPSNGRGWARRTRPSGGTASSAGRRGTTSDGRRLARGGGGLTVPQTWTPVSTSVSPSPQ